MERQHAAESESRRLVTSRIPSGWPVIVLAGLISATLLLLEPAKSSLLNAEELHIDLPGVLRSLLLPWLLGTGLLSLVGLVLHRTLGQRALALFIAIAIALWAQANLFVWQYGAIDGMDIDWSVHAGKGWLEAFAWCGLLTVAVLQAHRIAPLWRPIVLVLVLLQGTALATLVLERPSGTPENEGALAFEAPGFSVYSRDKNVIIIVLDALQSDIFAEALGDPATSSMLPPGFVYYRNAVSLYVSTQFSLPSILSGEAAPSGTDLRRWRSETAEKSLPARLTRQGFDVALMTFTSLLGSGCRDGSSPRCIHPSALLAGSSSAVEQLQRKEVSELVLLSVFRSTPHFLKPLVYTNGEWQLPYLLKTDEFRLRDPRILEASRLDLNVLDQLIEDMQADNVPPRFRFVHLFGIHFPTRLNRNCGFSEVSDQKPRDHLVETTRCMVGRVNDYLRKLDELGVYDNSFIAIVADHGTPTEQVRISGTKPPLPKQSEKAKTHLQDAARGLPVFLIKDFGKQGPLQVSDRPVSLCDIPASIYQALELEYETQCPSVLDEEGARPPRMHYRYANYRDQAKMTMEQKNRLEFRPYVVEGHSWRPESWQPMAE
jgi:hypothetical protein